jgi:hypothetical protein
MNDSSKTGIAPAAWLSFSAPLHVLAAVDLQASPWHAITVWTVGGLSFLVIMIFAFDLVPPGRPTLSPRARPAAPFGDLERRIERPTAFPGIPRATVVVMELTPSNPPPVQRFVSGFFEDAQDSLRRSLAECEALAREHPREALLGAVAFGVMLRSLPVPSFLPTGLRVVLLAAPAALGVVAVGAVAEYCRRNEAEISRRERLAARAAFEQGGETGVAETLSRVPRTPPL